MSRWFRHYAGMMRDEKLVAVAVKAKQPVERVLWVWGAILESAAEINDNGRYELDCDEVAYFLRADVADILAIVEGLKCSGRVGDDVVLKWADRQYQSDTSAARQAAYRERKRRSLVASDARKVTSDGGVTSRDGEVTPQDTDTDTDKKKDKAKALSKKGTRLPDYWVPKDDDWNMAADALGQVQARHEQIKFKDYWRSVPGQKGVKLDWDATWRNWIRSAAERRQQPRAQPPPKPVKEHRNADFIRNLAEIYKRDPSNPANQSRPTDAASAASDAGLSDSGTDRTIELDASDAKWRHV